MKWQWLVLLEGLLVFIMTSCGILIYSESQMFQFMQSELKVGNAMPNLRNAIKSINVPVYLEPETREAQGVVTNSLVWGISGSMSDIARIRIVANNGEITFIKLTHNGFDDIVNSDIDALLQANALRVRGFFKFAIKFFIFAQLGLLVLYLYPRIHSRWLRIWAGACIAVIGYVIVVEIFFCVLQWLRAGLCWLFF